MRTITFPTRLSLHSFRDGEPLRSTQGLEHVIDESADEMSVTGVLYESPHNMPVLPLVTFVEFVGGDGAVLTREGLDHLFQSFPGVRRLSLGGCWECEESVFEGLRNHALESLALSMDFSRSIRFWQSVARTKLKALNLSGEIGMPETGQSIELPITTFASFAPTGSLEGLRRTSVAMPHAEEINLFYTPDFRLEALVALTSSMPKLKRVRIDDPRRAPKRFNFDELKALAEERGLERISYHRAKNGDATDTIVLTHPPRDADT